MLIISIFIDKKVVFSEEINIEKKQVLKYINEYRENVNIEKLQLNENLNKASNSHSIYMNENSIFSHQEERGKENFSGIYFWDRAYNFEYEKIYLSEVIDQNPENYKESIQKMMENPYERIKILNSKFNEIGFGKDGKYYTYLLGGEGYTDDNLIIYPYNNQKNINDSWIIDREKNPYRNYIEDIKNVGVPISITYNTNKKIEDIKIENVEFKNVNTNEKIPYNIITPKNDEYLINTALILPTKKYEKNSKYSLTFNIIIEFSDENKKIIRKKVSFFTDMLKTDNENDIIFNVGDKKYLDVKGHWIERYIEEMDKKNIIFEKEKNIFAPDQDATREEVIKMIISSFDLKVNDINDSVFIDVNRDSEYYKYINTAFEYNIINGYSNNELRSFKPKNKITREEFILIIMKIYNDYVDNIEKENFDINTKEFKDIEKCSDWSKEYVKEAKQIGLINGRGNGFFYPKDNITRAETAITIFKLLNLIEKVDQKIIK